MTRAMPRCMHMRTATAVAGWCSINSQMSGSHSTIVTATARRNKTRRGSDDNRAMTTHAAHAITTPTAVRRP